jgi:transposase
MGAAYSRDLRERVITAMESDKFSRQEVATNFQVSVWYVDAVMKRVRETGGRDAKPWNGGMERVLKVHHDWIRAAVAEIPDITLDELCTGLKKDKQVNANPSMMCRELAKLALRLKKNRSMTVSAKPSG